VRPCYEPHNGTIAATDMYIAADLYNDMELCHPSIRATWK